MVVMVVDCQEIASSFSTEIKIIWQSRVKYFWFPVEREGEKEKEKKKKKMLMSHKRKRRKCFFFF